MIYGMKKTVHESKKKVNSMNLKNELRIYSCVNVRDIVLRK